MTLKILGALGLIVKKDGAPALRYKRGSEKFDLRENGRGGRQWVFGLGDLVRGTDMRGRPWIGLRA